MNFQPEVLVCSVIEDLLQGIANHLEQQKMQQFLINSISQLALTNLQSNINVMVTDCPQPLPMIEETLSDVLCLEKDTLMPKQLNKEAVVEQKLENVSMNLSMTSQGLKKTVSRVSRFNSLSVSSKPNSKNLIKQTNPQRSRKSQQSKAQPLRPSLIEEDPQIERLRKYTEARLQGEIEYKKLQINHQKSYRSKMEELKSFNLQDPLTSITNDYDGESIKSIIIDDKIKYYSARPNLGATSRKIQEGKQSISNEISQIGKRIVKEREPPRQLKALDIPIFPATQSPTPKNPSFRNYRLSQYKKMFGRGFSRLDNQSQTIDYCSSVVDPTDQIFCSKKHFNDSLDISTLGRSQIRNNSVARRLALPKLHGRYKVLDRYSEL